MRTLILAASTCSAMAMFADAPALADGKVNTGYFGGVAIMGYDPVAYFTDGRATMGSEKFSYNWLGTPWYFVNNKHRELFKSEPAKYAPQFGGYCAGEVAFGGLTVNVDPDAWRIIDGKLYLAYDKGFIAELEAHLQDYLPNAEANWPKLEAGLANGKYY